MAILSLIETSERKQAGSANATGVSRPHSHIRPGFKARRLDDGIGRRNIGGQF